MERKPSIRRATILDVARAAGVSAATVSNALTSRRPVETGTRERVEAAARALGYVPDPAAQRLRTGRPGAVALISSMPAAVAAGESRLGFLMEVAAAAAEGALDADLALVLVPPSKAGPPRLDHLDVAGAILLEPLVADPSLAALRRRGIACVAIGRCEGFAAEVPFVDLHSAQTARLLLGHLADMGSRRTALLLGQQRRPSYADAAAVHAELAGKLGQAPIVARIDEAGGPAAARAACLDLLAAHPEIDAFCAPVDAFAVGVLAALKTAGRAVPATARVVTRYDGLRARTAVPPLTAIDLALDRIAERAIALLLRALTGEEAGPLPEVPLPRLVVRGSSQAAP